MIFPVESQSDVRSKPALPLTTTLGPVQIAVTDRDNRKGRVPAGPAPL